MAQYICVLDFEATCWDGSDNHEIIEFPSVMLKWEGQKVTEVGRIQNYVKPLTNPTVSAYCENLTGISQETVDQVIDLKDAIKAHSKWMADIAPHSQITIVTCGNWDLKTMLPMDMKNIKIKPEHVYTQWVNIKDLFKHITLSKPKPLSGMLSHFKMEFEGSPHSGIDDSHNIARIFMELVNKGLTKKIFMTYISSNK